MWLIPKKHLFTLLAQPTINRFVNQIDAVVPALINIA
jgi:hypothetical protein